MKMLFLRGVPVLILLFAGSPSQAEEQARTALEPLSIVTQNGVVNFAVEIADTPEERRKGLMFRESLPEEQGMLFEFDAVGHASFWMKNTSVSLDIIFIEGDGTIAKIARRTTPFSRKNITSGVPVAGVLEINAGLSDSLGIREGDVVQHPFFPAFTAQQP